ncbi:B3 domain-containing transcription factor VRN1-like isoform X1 [Carya illinoinensis]|uniref:TF-B3 domain-containing protein n=1 Tax=Carya illinoinensis TaxID=32201 RepID=A0A8T1RB91_CARIL|nr:B3 domain-containing transcription factor VRN1-like isoform X1 [Carya illinoinensis]XP_042962372.1 B3 domain-containing transcription factor VRN1-like isoform X1 [Carya illinoinensis]XP_042962376.1 B3 domain-containing transcription factor VRN1-like isoform X1 [Carya illinoinensis]XP_042962380.1 B3 domain-containing transcription factor VRN1-like isoform X1 [Carya illinoinensis]XP_042962385.1 B3 domain-containing transcription factor VRN1-like isoform X1 [Carya illinoinensis]XP_042962391.1 
MTSQGQRDCDSTASTLKAPHFFKIILPRCLQDRKLRFPKKFVRKYGEGLSNLALLKLPNGAEWKVELRQCDGGVWFQKGWQEFLEYYSIKLGHLLVFKYEGHSRFNVLVFDESATEIEYPFNSSLGEDKLDAEILASPMEETRADGSVEILDDFPKDTKTREKSWLPCPRAHKMMRTNPSEKTTSNLNMPRLAQQNLHSTKQELEEQCPKYNVPRTRTMRVDEKTRALEKASGFKPENPYFVAVMQPSYVGSKNYLNLPLRFAKSYLNKKVDTIILRVLDGRYWSVKYIFQMSATMSRGVFGCGWKVFAQDNNLEVGDVCVFELIEGIETSFQVVIFHATQEHCPQSPGELKFSAKRESRNMTNSPTRRQSHISKRQQWTARDKARALERASSFKSENPFLMVVMWPSHVCKNSNLVSFEFQAVPDSFLKSRYMKERRRIVMLQVGDESWPVTVLTTSARVTMSGGWSTFARDNKLQTGDVCVFELIKSDDDILKVSIFRCLG